MSAYYRSGRLVSNDTVKILGRRTLVGATREDIWGGTATARPVPGGVQIEALSSSAADDATVTDVWDVTVGGLTDANDIARITVNGTAYRALVTGGWTTDQVAEALRSAIASGSVETWMLTPGGTADAGDTYRTTVNAVNYDFVAVGGENVAALCAGIAASLAGCPEYTVVDGGTFVGMTAVAAGVTPDVSVSLPVDAGGDATFTATQLIAGVAAATVCTVGRVGSVVTLTSATPGSGGILTVTSAYDTDPDIDGTVVAVHTATGATGAGIGSIRVDYLDANGVRQSETITLNGVTAVASVATDIEQILAVTATTVGTSGGAVGTITIRVVAAGATLEVIAIGACQTLSADYTVPVRQRAFVALLIQSVSVASEIALLSDTNPATGAVVSGAAFTWASLHAGPQHSEVDPAMEFGPFPAGSRIWIACTGAVGRVALVQADLYLEPAQ